MQYDIKTYLNLIIPISLFIAWIVAEFRWRTSIRIGLGLLCILFPFLWIWATIYSSNSMLCMHRYCLYQIERMVQNGQDAQVCEAIQAFDKIYQETQSSKTAAFALLNTLHELERDDLLENKEKMDIKNNDSQKEKETRK